MIRKIRKKGKPKRKMRMRRMKHDDEPPYNNECMNVCLNCVYPNSYVRKKNIPAFVQSRAE